MDAPPCTDTFLSSLPAAKAMKITVGRPEGTLGSRGPLDRSRLLLIEILDPQSFAVLADYRDVFPIGRDRDGSSKGARR